MTFALDSSWVVVDGFPDKAIGSKMLSPEPDYEAALGIIRHLSTDELKDLVNDDSKVQSLVEDLPQVKNLASEKEVLLASNKSIAEYSLGFESRLSQGKQDLIEKYEEYAKVLESVQNLNSKIESSSTKQSADTVLALLQTAAHELEEESEESIKSFLNNEQTIETFLSEFVPMRTKSHERKIKSEKMEELLKASSTAIPSTSGMWSVPYPSQMGNMPVPMM